MEPGLKRTIRTNTHQSVFPFGVWGAFFCLAKRKPPRPRKEIRFWGGSKRKFRCSFGRCWFAKPAALNFLMLQPQSPCISFAGTTLALFVSADGANISKKKAARVNGQPFLEAPSGFEPENRGFAVPCLTTWLWRHMERATRFELATSTLARWRSAK